MTITIGGAEHEIRFTMRAWRALDEAGYELETIRQGADDRARALVALMSALLRGADAAMPETDALQILAALRTDEMPALLAAASAEIRRALRVRESARKPDAAINPTLERLDRKYGDRQAMTYRHAAGCGLIAGLSWTEMDDLDPGLVIDLYIVRQRYDDQQHGIKRNKEEPIDKGIDWGRAKEAGECRPIM